jgi:hypothetical protein
MRAGSTTRTLTLNTPSYTRPTTTTHPSGSRDVAAGWFWHRQHRFEEAKSEALRALDAFEKLGAADDVERVRELLQQIDLDACESGDDGELLTTVLSVVFIDSSYSDRTAKSNDGIDTWLEVHPSASYQRLLPSPRLALVL